MKKERKNAQKKICGCNICEADRRYCPCEEFEENIEKYTEIATEQDRIARAEEQEKAELNFCIVCDNYDYCEQRYDCKLFNKFSKAMKE